MNARQRRTALRKRPVLSSGGEFRAPNRIVVTFDGVTIGLLRNVCEKHVAEKPSGPISQMRSFDLDSFASAVIDQWHRDWEEQFSREHDLMMNPPTHFSGIFKP